MVLKEEVKDIFSGSRPSWCLCWTSAGVRSLFQSWRQLEVSTLCWPQLYLPTQPCVCARSNPTVTTSRYVDIGTHSFYHHLYQWFKMLFLPLQESIFDESKVLFNFQTVKWPLEDQESLTGCIIKHDMTQTKSYRGAFMPHLH